MTGSSSRATQEPGRIGRTLLRLLMRPTTVSACEEIAENFRLITLEGPALRDVAWSPGHKMQIAMGSVFTARTYTPIEWDVVAGRTRLLGYAHGNGPGSSWIRKVAVGGRCDVFGPRRSLKVSDALGAFGVLGDETSIGLAYAFVRDGRARPETCLFEVSDIEVGRRVLTRLGLEQALLFQNGNHGGNFAGIEAALSSLAAKDLTFLLTGEASTIHLLRQILRGLGVPAARIVAKAYWAPGKMGLD